MSDDKDIVIEAMGFEIARLEGLTAFYKSEITKLSGLFDRMTSAIQDGDCPKCAKRMDKIHELEMELGFYRRSTEAVNRALVQYEISRKEAQLKKSVADQKLDRLVAVERINGKQNNPND